MTYKLNRKRGLRVHSFSIAIAVAKSKQALNHKEKCLIQFSALSDVPRSRQLNLINIIFLTTKLKIPSSQSLFNNFRQTGCEDFCHQRK